MLNIQVTRDAAGQVTAARVVSQEDRTAESRWNWRSLAAAEAVAAALGEGYIATDAGPHVSPRFDVIALPKVGDEVSYAFNGDYYPCGTVTRISAGPTFRRIQTSDGRVFYRRRLTGAWVMDGTWSLVPGHISKRNPEL